MKLFYHGDMDGIASASILLHKIISVKTIFSTLKKKSEEDTIIEFDYNKQQDLKNLELHTTETVYFVDCCPDKEILDEIVSNAHKVFVIDHHISRKEILEDYYESGKINGMFYNGASATLITYCWATMIKEQGKTVEEVKQFLDWFTLSRMNQERSEIPLAIKLINSWDIWNGFYVDAEPYKIAFESQHFFPKNEQIRKFLYNNETISNAIKKGYIMKEQMDSWAETFMKRFGYEVSYKNYKFFVANLGNRK